MYRLEKLGLNGFKSFTSPTEFTVRGGITAVVGPNGCGKSNIADAINWVIGEQRTRTLRAEHMGDVIFNGTDKRRPMGLAEVSIHLMQNGEEAVPSDDRGGNGQPEGSGLNGDRSVSITRRLFRSGDSEYLIDGQRCRLRDVQELLAEIRVGTGVYSIIEQGKVDAVLASRPRDRRVLIEEAAGIALFKIRKRQAQTKLEATEANLLRINDIVGEIERQIGSLKRQAARARRYARITEAIDRAERILLGHEAAELDQRASRLRERRAEVQVEESEAAATLGRDEARLEEARATVSRETAKHQEARDALHDLDRAIDSLRARVERWREEESEARSQIERSRAEGARLDGRLAEVEERRSALATSRDEAARECAAAEDAVRDRETISRVDYAALQSAEAALDIAREDLTAAAGELSDARSQVRRLEDLIGRCEADIAEMDREGEATDSDSAALAARRSQQEERAAQAVAAVAAALERAVTAEGKRGEESALRERLLLEREETRGRLKALEERLDSLHALADGAGPELEGIEGRARLKLLSDFLAPPEELDRAVDASLSALLRGYLASSAEEAVAIVEVLKDRGRGRAVLVPSDGARPGRRDAPPLPSGAEGVVGGLGDLLGGPEPLPPALAMVLARIVVATDVRSALRLRDRLAGHDIVTLQGDFFSRDGWVEGGAELPKEAGVMTLRRLVGRLSAEAAAARARIAELDDRIGVVEARIGELAVTAAEWRDRETVLSRELEGLRLRTETLEEEATRISLRREAQAGERARLEEDAVVLRSDLSQVAARHAALIQRREELQRAVESRTGECDALRASLSLTGEEVQGLRERASEVRERRAALEVEFRHHEELVVDVGQRIAGEAEEHRRWEARLQEARTRAAGDGEALADRMAERILAEGTVRSVEAALLSRREALSACEGAERGARQRLEAIRERSHEVALEEERLAGDWRSMEGRVAERGWPGVEEAIGDLSDEETARDAEDVARELEDLRSKRERMGPVNLMAVDQFRELEERHTFIVGQRKDLEESIQSLKETIARINRQSRERFLDAFEKTRSYFGELFRILFDGGRADLRLVAPEGDGDVDVLEAGLEITAQPPGKRLQSISLLSGGEKALTAIALLFALFRYSPSPFCLLDEVDAPLDEANVLRFVNLLRSMASETQFIVVTHNRRTMEAADMLYGITMEEPGISRTVSIVMGSADERREVAQTLPGEMAARHSGDGRGARVPSRAAPPIDS
jgi:chromosome segregation protein